MADKLEARLCVWYRIMLDENRKFTMSSLGYKDCKRCDGYNTKCKNYTVLPQTALTCKVVARPQNDREDKRSEGSN